MLISIKPFNVMSIVYFLVFHPVYANCNCGSVDQSKPCSGNDISVLIGSDRTVTFNWEFNSQGGEVYCGKFLNGDYWVAPSTGNSSITLTSLTGVGSGAVSLDDNPKLESMGLLDSSITYGNYSSIENIQPDLPVTFTSSTSLVAAIQRNEVLNGKCGTKAILGNCADAYNIVTVLMEVPKDAGSTLLRPSIDELEKRLWSIDDFDFTRLPVLDYFEGTDSAGLEKIRQRWSYSTEVLGIKTINGDTYSEGGRAFRASLLIDDYGAGVAQQWHNDLVVLFSSDHTASEIMAPLSAMLIYGKDIFHAIYDEDGMNFERTRNWGSGAGQSLGKFPPAAFFASLAISDAYSNILQETSEKLLGFSDIRGPQELDQINRLSTREDSIPVWGDLPDIMSESEIGAYWGGMLKSQCFDGATGTCDPSFGKKTSRDPYGYIDGPPNLPGTSYMVVSLGPIRSFVATMSLIPEMSNTVNYNDLFWFVDRVHKNGVFTANDPCAPPDPRENPTTCDAYRNEGCEYYGLSNTGTATWGPNPNNLGQCIYNNENQSGRFPNENGKKIDYGYTSMQIEKNWDEITKTITPGLPTNLQVE